ncbi:MAG: ribonuclease P protein component [Bryobacteraceae bacterium]
MRILRPADFRRVYAEGLRVSGPYFAAFCLSRAGTQGPRIGLTAPRALGKSVIRNRIKRRIREAVRRQLRQLEPQWEIVINPRRAVLKAPFAELAREIGRLFSRCKL